MVVSMAEKRDTNEETIELHPQSQDQRGSSTVSNESSKNNNTLENKPVLSVFGSRRSQEHMKELLSLQLDFIEQQQLKISRKDRQILSLRSEKEQLEARLNRMERRLALQKRQTLDCEDVPVKTKNSLSSKSLQTTTGVGSKLSPCVPITVTSRNDKLFKFNAYLNTNETYLHIKDTKFLNSFENLLQDADDEKKRQEMVSVPPWKVLTKDEDILHNTKEEEDVSNEAFIKRHSRPETDEKRRKRWDLQLMRQQRQHEMLVKKYNEREKKINSNNVPSNSTVTTDVKTLYRNSDNAIAIEVSNMIPVCIFGHSLPAVEYRELNLPWFNIAKRENQIRTSKQKVLKRLKTSQRETRQCK